MQTVDIVNSYRLSRNQTQIPLFRLDRFGVAT